VSELVAWIAAQGTDEPRVTGAAIPGTLTGKGEQANKSFNGGCDWQKLPVHGLTRPRQGLEKPDARCGERSPDLWLYRNRTRSLLRRYMRLSLEAGRLPSVIGREFFRSKITSYSSATFEDRVIFVHDVEVCLERLDEFDRNLIARVILQEHDHELAARFLHCARKTIERRLPELLDELSEELLKVRLLEPLPDIDSDGRERRSRNEV
jgi:hypothetical protein